MLEIRTPSRLHFGLLSFGNPAVAKYGGCGVMIERPALRLTLDQANQFSAQGATAGRIREFAERWSRTHRCKLPPVAIRATQTPRQHVGLGLGTGAQPLQALASAPPALSPAPAVVGAAMPAGHTAWLERHDSLGRHDSQGLFGGRQLSDDIFH